MSVEAEKGETLCLNTENQNQEGREATSMWQPAERDILKRGWGSVYQVGSE